jgi:low temperature requirement protein LtrA
MTSESEPRGRLTATLRREERVTPLELFFDLVFVLAITQCTALMSGSPTWTGLARGLLVLGVLWWSWVGYAWLTSVVEPEEGMVRIVIFVAMAGLLVAALCVPGAFEGSAMLFAVAYAIVRGAHIALFVIASRDDPGLRHSVAGLAISTAIGVGFLVAAALTDSTLQGSLWLIALMLDMGGPLVIDATGWRLVPGHFAERHGLIVIIALGESIVAIGVGAGAIVDAGVVACAVIGMALAAALWWIYFDVTSIAAEQNLRRLPSGRERNALARDAYSYLHFPIVAGIVLVALGLKKTLNHAGDPLDLVPAAALVGGVSVYLLAIVAFKARSLRIVSRDRLVAGLAVLVLIPLGVRIPSLATLALLTAAVIALIGYEATRFSESRGQIRATLHAHPDESG